MGLDYRPIWCFKVISFSPFPLPKCCPAPSQQTPALSTVAAVDGRSSVVCYKGNTLSVTDEICEMHWSAHNIITPMSMVLKRRLLLGHQLQWPVLARSPVCLVYRMMFKKLFKVLLGYTDRTGTVQQSLSVVLCCFAILQCSTKASVAVQKQ